MLIWVMLLLLCILFSFVVFVFFFFFSSRRRHTRYIGDWSSDVCSSDLGTPAAQVIDYCNRWHAAVAGAGYVPGLYVGFHCGLDATQLYRALRFSHYWCAYNLNADEMPIVRGL